VRSEGSNDTNWDRTSDLPICSTAPYHCATVLYRPLFLHMPPESVHRTVVNAFTGTINLKPFFFLVKGKSKFHPRTDRDGPEGE